MINLLTTFSSRRCHWRTLHDISVSELCTSSPAQCQHWLLMDPFQMSGLLCSVPLSANENQVMEYIHVCKASVKNSLLQKAHKIASQFLYQISLVHFLYMEFVLHKQPVVILPEKKLMENSHGTNMDSAYTKCFANHTRHFWYEYFLSVHTQVSWHQEIKQF